MYEHEDGSWSFADKDQSREYIGLCNAILEGIKTEYFDVVAHPDRSFRRCKEWTEDMMQVSSEIVMAAKWKNVLLERNYSSMKNKHQYWKQFWSKEALANSICGYDVHSVEEMETIWSLWQFLHEIWLLKKKWLRLKRYGVNVNYWQRKKA